MDQKTNMPDKEDKKNVYQLPLRVLPQQNIKVRWAWDVDFLKNIVLNYNTSEYGGYKTRNNDDEGPSLKQVTSAMYTPLI